MIPYGVYKVLHLVSIMGVYIAMGAMLFHMRAGGARKFPQKRFLMITHGAAMIFVLIGGFGLLARLGLAHDGLPGWAWAKLTIWLVLGFGVAIIFRKPKWSLFIWWFTLVLGGTAAYLANYKPF